MIEFIHPKMESDSVPRATCSTDLYGADSRQSELMALLCMSAQQSTSYEVGFEGPSGVALCWGCH